MKRFGKLFVAVVLLALCFAAGFKARDWKDQKEETIEGMAVGSLLADITYIQLLHTAKYDDLRRLLDMNMAEHLRLAREHHGAIQDQTFAQSRVIVLSQIADIWEREPPFQNPRPQGATQESWYATWEAMQRDNVAMVREAKLECEKTNCRRRPPP